MQKVKGYEACTAGLLSDVLYLWNESKSRTKSCLSHRGHWCKTKALETATFWHSYFVIKDFIYEKKKKMDTLCVCAHFLAVITHCTPLSSFLPPRPKFNLAVLHSVFSSSVALPHSDLWMDCVSSSAPPPPPSPQQEFPAALQSLSRR